MFLLVGTTDQASVDSVTKEYRLAIDQGALFLMSNTVGERKNGPENSEEGSDFVV